MVYIGLYYRKEKQCLMRQGTCCSTESNFLFKGASASTKLQKSSAQLTASTTTRLCTCWASKWSSTICWPKTRKWSTRLSKMKKSQLSCISKTWCSTITFFSECTPWTKPTHRLWARTTPRIWAKNTCWHIWKKNKK